MNSKLNELCKSLYRVCVSRLVTHLLRYSLTLTTLFIWNIHTALHCTYTGYLAVGHTLYYCSALAYNMLPLTECSLSLSEHDAHNSSAADALQALYTSPYPSHTHLLPLSVRTSAHLRHCLICSAVPLPVTVSVSGSASGCVSIPQPRNNVRRGIAADILYYCWHCMLLHVAACCCMLLHAPHSPEKGQNDKMRKDTTVLCTQQGSKGEDLERKGGRESQKERLVRERDRAIERQMGK